jgi:hypothetical protein
MFKTDKELKLIAKKVFNNEIFMAFNEEQMTAFNCILMLMDRKDIPENLGAVYAEYNNHDYPMSTVSCNGYPQFFGCSFLTIDEREKVIDYIKEMQEFMDKFQ